ncbi:MAG: hypothetical protein AAFW46_13955 [Pseudomonadota bacterium]
MRDHETSLRAGESGGPADAPGFLWPARDRRRRPAPASPTTGIDPVADDRALTTTGARRARREPMGSGSPERKPLSPPIRRRPRALAEPTPARKDALRAPPPAVPSLRPDLGPSLSIGRRRLRSESGGEAAPGMLAAATGAWATLSFGAEARPS